MSATLLRPARAARVLFAEDFDGLEGVTVIEAPAEPEVIAPAFSAADAEIIRARAYADGRAAAAREADTAHRLAVQEALAGTGAALRELGADGADAAARAAEDVARLLLDTLATLLPALCARHGEAEVRAVARAVLPALAREPAVTVRVHPDLAGAMEDELGRLDPDLARRVSLVAGEAVPPGDVRVNWAGGQAVRDAGLAWEGVAAALTELGLLLPAVPVPETTRVG